MYEIEHRALLTEEKFKKLSDLLSSKAILLGKDDKQVSYYIFSDKLLKVVRNISQGTAKISLKFNTLGTGSMFQEVEVTFPEESFSDMHTICNEISSPDQIITGTQKRTNYKYDGVEIALKWSEDWGYHAEFEIMVSDPTEKETADTHIREVASILSVPLMTEKEIAEFSAAVRNKQKSK